MEAQIKKFGEKQTVNGKRMTKMCIWSDVANDCSAGFDIQEDGSMKPRKIGCWVMSLECMEMMINEKNKRNTIIHN